MIAAWHIGLEGTSEGLVNNRVLHECKFKIRDGLILHRLNKICNDSFVLSIVATSARDWTQHFTIFLQKSGMKNNSLKYLYIIDSVIGFDLEGKFHKLIDECT